MESLNYNMSASTTLWAGQKAEVQQSAISTQIKPLPTTSYEKVKSAAAKAREDKEQRERRQKTEQDELAQRMAAEADARAELEELQAQREQEQQTALEVAKQTLIILDDENDDDHWMSDMKDWNKAGKKKKGSVVAVKAEKGAKGKVKAEKKGDADQSGAANTAGEHFMVLARRPPASLPRQKLKI